MFEEYRDRIKNYFTFRLSILTLLNSILELMDKVFNWGIIAPGKIARKFAMDLQQIPGAKLHAVASRSLDRAKAFANDFKAPHFYEGYEELVHCPDLHAVYIASPNVAHLEHTLLCLDAKIPVLCEKPFALNSAQVAQMIERSEATNTFLMEALWTRLLPSMRQTIELIEKGTIGTVLGVKADFGFKAPFNPASRLFDPKLGGGSLLDIGIYPILLSQIILGKPEKIIAKAHLGSTKVDEECAMLFTYANGAMAQLHSSIRFKTKTEAFIYGSEGVIHLHSRWHETKQLSILVEGERPRDMHFDYPERGYRFEIEEVMRCVREGKRESTILPLSFSRDLMALMDEIRSQINLVYPDYD